MKLHVQSILEKGRITLVIFGHLLSTLAWSRRIVRRARPIFYLTDGLMVSCAFITALWIV